VRRVAGSGWRVAGGKRERLSRAAAVGRRRLSPLPATCHPLPVVAPPLPATCHPLPVVAPPLPATCHPLPVVAPPLPATCDPLPVAAL